MGLIFVREDMLPTAKQPRVQRIFRKYGAMGWKFELALNPGGVGLLVNGKHFHQLQHAQSNFNDDDFVRLQEFFKSLENDNG